MPPFLPRKRLASTPPPQTSGARTKKTKLNAATKAHTGPKPTPVAVRDPTGAEDDDSEFSLSEVDSEVFEDVPQPSNEFHGYGKEEDEEIEWEDAAVEDASGGPKSSEQIRDLQLTLPKDDDGVIDYGASTSTGKKGPTRREKEVRLMVHRLHVQFLLHHNAIRNNWVSDREVQETLVNQLPVQIMKEVEKWHVASGLKSTQDSHQTPKRPGRRRKGGRKEMDVRKERDWGRPSERLEHGKPDLSNGNPLIHLMKVLSAYWKKRFAITAPGLRKRGYGSKLARKREIHSLRNDPHDPRKHGERICDLTEFREAARACEGSRDLGAQLFTALIRGLGIEARLVASLQPTGFGWTKAEQMPITAAEDDTTAIQASLSGSGKQPVKSARRKTETDGSSTSLNTKRKPKSQDIVIIDTSEDSALSDGESLIDITPSTLKQRPAKFDRDLLFPIYWTEIVSHVDNSILPVSPLVLPQSVASTPEVLSSFEPRGAKAEKVKQVIAYVVAYSPDGTAKDVTVRYLRKRIWPGKTRGFRMPVEKIPVFNKHGKVKRYEEFDWFKTMISGYVRTEEMRTAVDDLEDTADLVPAEPEKKQVDEEVDTLQSLKASAEFVLERHLRREEALRPGSKTVRTFTSGKGDNFKEESVYRRSDVERCLTAESWHKEGRRPKEGESPMKLVPVRAVTLTRKREAEEHERQTGEKQTQGLYSWDQTEYIIPPPIKDGIIPKNAYGNMDCFVPSMVPKGAVHIPLKGTIRICKKLEIDYAEAVTGFEFGNKRAVPVCTGVVIASENEKAVRKAWKVWNEEQRKKEEGKLEKTCLDVWRKMMMSLRIRERVAGDYANGDELDVEERVHDSHSHSTPYIDNEGDGGGFLLPHDDDEGVGDFVMDGQDGHEFSTTSAKATDQYPTPASIPLTTTKSRQKSRKSIQQNESSESSVTRSLSASCLEDDEESEEESSLSEVSRSETDASEGTEQDEYLPTSSKTKTPSTSSTVVATESSSATPRSSRRVRKNGVSVTSQYFKKDA